MNNSAAIFTVGRCSCPNKPCPVHGLYTADEQLTSLIKVINDSVKDTAFPHKLYEALVDGDTRKMKPISEIMELAKEIEDDSK